MTNIIDFKTRAQQLDEWWREVYNTNFKDKNIKSVLVIYEAEDDKGRSIANHARFECDKSNMEWFNNCLSDKVRELQFDEWMREHVNDYIGYIE